MDRDDPAVAPARETARRRFAFLALLWLAPLVFLGVFYFYPLGSILALSFRRAEGGWLGPLLDTLTAPSVLRVLWFTMYQAGLSTALTLLVGLPGAYLLGRYEFRGKAALRALTGIPFVLPTLVVAAAFNALLGPRGWVNEILVAVLDLPAPPLQFTNTLAAILVAHVFYNTTIVLRLVGDFWAHLNPRLEDAARVLGASRWAALRRVTLPLLSPAVAAATLLVFIFDFTSFGVVLVLGGPRFATLEVEIFYQTVSLFNLPVAATLSLLQLGATLGLMIAYTRLTNRISRPLSLHPQRYSQQRLLTWRGRLFAGALIGALLVFFLAPLAALTAALVHPAGP